MMQGNEDWSQIRLQFSLYFSKAHINAIHKLAYIDYIALALINWCQTQSCKAYSIILMNTFLV